MIQKDMFNLEDWKERIGTRVTKTAFLGELKQVEDYFVDGCIERGLDAVYDITADENPDFKTMGYTEWASSFIAYPLNNNLRRDMITDAELDDVEVIDFSSYFDSVIESNNANKYTDRQKPRQIPRKNLVVLVGSNVMREIVSLVKLVEIKDRGDVYFKPHPLTTHEIIGIMKDNLGEENVLPRDLDMYHFLNGAEKVYGTYYTEAMLYASVQEKDIETIELRHRGERAGFFHLNRWLFRLKGDKRNRINKMLSSPYSGVFNPRVDKDWKNKVDLFLNYMMEQKEFFNGWYIDEKKDDDSKK